MIILFSLNLKKSKLFIFLSCLACFLLSSFQTKAYENKYLFKVNKKSQLTYKEKQYRKSTLISNLNEIKKEKNFELMDQYILGPGDLLSIKFLGSDFLREFSGRYPILNDGNVNLPIIGTKYLNNLSLNQAKKLLINEYGKEIISPNIYLQLESARPIKVSIVGEIIRPGIYSMTNNEISSLKGIQSIQSNGLPTVIDALQKAGGITNNANLKKVLIKRKIPGPKKEYKIANINLLDIIFKGDQTQNPPLFDGDIITIEKADSINKNELLQISSSNLSPAIINVRIIGSVYSPGVISLSNNTPLSQAIYAAGGPKDWKSNKGNVELIRINRNGSAILKKYRINLMENVNEKTNPPLLDGDIVKINPNILSKTGSAVGAVVEPVSGIVTALSLFRLLN